MKRIISFVLLVVLSISLCACSEASVNKNPPDQQMISVLNSEICFISETGEKTLLKDFVWGWDEVTEYVATPSKYSFVDFDNDGVTELVVDITPNQVYYMVFHKNNGDVYGFLIERRSMQQLNTDGSFLATGGAISNYYCKMEFEDSSYKIIYTAIDDQLSGVYEINGEKCSADEVEKYIEEWFSKEEAKWIKLQ